ncbi:MAG: PA0069 family radical SAM protein [Gammaproteobacteria bacterium]|nr:PA0069 family radical SAM protein [Gammaproteobacteria bacterium]
MFKEEAVVLHINKGRGAVSNATGRFESLQREEFDDGWFQEEREPPKTEIIADRSRSIITYNQSPDVPFDRSINPYKGCEHGCSYCFARPTHAYLGYSPGLDFETKIVAKHDARELLEKELRKPGYKPAVVALGANTDAYQPVERKLEITRGILGLLAEFRHPVTIITKSALIERDLELLASMAKENLVRVAISITSLHNSVGRKLEPRAATPKRRLQLVKTLSEAGIPVSVLFAPVIPGFNDEELEQVLTGAKEAGADEANYVLLRLPLETAELFYQWLELNEPLKAQRIINLIRDARGGNDYDTAFGSRMRGTGAYAAVIEKRFKLTSKRLGLNARSGALDTRRFRIPKRCSKQLSLF